ATAQIEIRRDLKKIFPRFARGSARRSRALRENHHFGATRRLRVEDAASRARGGRSLASAKPIDPRARFCTKMHDRPRPFSSQLARLVETEKCAGETPAHNQT